MPGRLPSEKKFILVDSDPWKEIQPGPLPTNLCVLISQLVAAAAPKGLHLAPLQLMGIYRPISGRWRAIGLR